jgi:hypothetical protein
MFWLLCDKDSYTGRFLVLLTSICVLQHKLVHICQTSSPVPNPLPIVASARLRLLYSLLYSDHINHIQGFGFFPFPHPSLVQSTLSMRSVSNNITTFVLGLKSMYEREHMIFGL